MEHSCEFAYVEASRTVMQTYGAGVIPVLILRHHGKEIARFVNTLGPEDVRQAIEAAVA
jgi:hypothetical protein